MTHYTQCMSRVDARGRHTPYDMNMVGSRLLCLLLLLLLCAAFPFPFPFPFPSSAAAAAAAAAAHSHKPRIGSDAGFRLEQSHESGHAAHSVPPTSVPSAFTSPPVPIPIPAAMLTVSDVNFLYDGAALRLPTVGLLVSPSRLDFGSSQLFVPRSVTLELRHGGGDSPIHLSAITSKSKHFHVQNFEPTIIAPGESIIAQITFLPRACGTIIGRIEIQASVASADGKPHKSAATVTDELLVLGVGERNEYGLIDSTLTGIVVTVDAVLSQPIHISNSHPTETLYVQEVFTTENYLSLGLPPPSHESITPLPPTSDDATSPIWEVPPSTLNKHILHLIFSSAGRQVGRYGGYVHLHTNRHFLILPVHITVVADPILFDPDRADFGSVRIFESRNPPNIQVSIANLLSRPIMVFNPYLAVDDTNSLSHLRLSWHRGAGRAFPPCPILSDALGRVFRPDCTAEELHGVLIPPRTTLIHVLTLGYTHVEPPLDTPPAAITNESINIIFQTNYSWDANGTSITTPSASISPPTLDMVNSIPFTYDVRIANANFFYNHAQTFFPLIRSAADWNVSDRSSDAAHDARSDPRDWADVTRELQLYVNGTAIADSHLCILVESVQLQRPDAHFEIRSNLSDLTFTVRDPITIQVAFRANREPITDIADTNFLQLTLRAYRSLECLNGSSLTLPDSPSELVYIPLHVYAGNLAYHLFEKPATLNETRARLQFRPPHGPNETQKGNQLNESEAATHAASPPVNAPNEIGWKIKKVAPPNTTSNDTDRTQRNTITRLASPPVHALHQRGMLELGAQSIGSSRSFLLLVHNPNPAPITVRRPDLSTFFHSSPGLDQSTTIRAHAIQSHDTLRVCRGVVTFDAPPHATKQRTVAGPTHDRLVSLKDFITQLNLTGYFHADLHRTDDRPFDSIRPVMRAPLDDGDTARLHHSRPSLMNEPSDDVDVLQHLLDRHLYHQYLESLAMLGGEIVCAPDDESEEDEEEEEDGLPPATSELASGATMVYLVQLTVPTLSDLAHQREQAHDIFDSHDSSDDSSSIPSSGFSLSAELSFATSVTRRAATLTIDWSAVGESIQLMLPEMAATGPINSKLPNSHPHPMAEHQALWIGQLWPGKIIQIPLFALSSHQSPVRLDRRRLHLSLPWVSENTVGMVKSLTHDELIFDALAHDGIHSIDESQLMRSARANRIVQTKRDRIFSLTIGEEILLPPREKRQIGVITVRIPFPTLPPDARGAQLDEVKWHAHLLRSPFAYLHALAYEWYSDYIPSALRIQKSIGATWAQSLSAAMVLSPLLASTVPSPILMTFFSHVPRRFWSHISLPTADVVALAKSLELWRKMQLHRDGTHIRAEHGWNNRFDWFNQSIQLQTNLVDDDDLDDDVDSHIDPPPSIDLSSSVLNFTGVFVPRPSIVSGFYDESAVRNLAAFTVILAGEHGKPIHEIDFGLVEIGNYKEVRIIYAHPYQYTSGPPTRRHRFGNVPYRSSLDDVADGDGDDDDDGDLFGFESDPSSPRIDGDGDAARYRPIVVEADYITNAYTVSDIPADRDSVDAASHRDKGPHLSTQGNPFSFETPADILSSDPAQADAVRDFLPNVRVIPFNPHTASFSLGDKAEHAFHRVIFSPTACGAFESVFVSRNNLTRVEMIVLRGQSARGSINFHWTRHGILQEYSNAFAQLILAHSRSDKLRLSSVPLWDPPLATDALTLVDIFHPVTQDRIKFINQAPKVQLGSIEGTTNIRPNATHADDIDLAYPKAQSGYPAIVLDVFEFFRSYYPNVRVESDLADYLVVSNDRSRMLPQLHVPPIPLHGIGTTSHDYLDERAILQLPFENWSVQNDGKIAYYIVAVSIGPQVTISQSRTRAQFPKGASFGDRMPSTAGRYPIPANHINACDYFMASQEAHQSGMAIPTGYAHAFLFHHCGELPLYLPPNEQRWFRLTYPMIAILLPELLASHKGSDNYIAQPLFLHLHTTAGIFSMGLEMKLPKYMRAQLQLPSSILNYSPCHPNDPYLDPPAGIVPSAMVWIIAYFAIFAGFVTLVNMRVDCIYHRCALPVWYFLRSRHKKARRSLGRFATSITSFAMPRIRATSDAIKARFASAAAAPAARADEPTESPALNHEPAVPSKKKKKGKSASSTPRVEPPPVVAPSPPPSSGDAATEEPPSGIHLTQPKKRKKKRNANATTAESTTTPTPTQVPSSDQEQMPSSKSPLVALNKIDLRPQSESSDSRLPRDLHPSSPLATPIESLSGPTSPKSSSPSPSPSASPSIVDSSDLDVWPVCVSVPGVSSRPAVSAGLTVKSHIGHPDKPTIKIEPIAAKAKSNRTKPQPNNKGNTHTPVRSNQHTEQAGTASTNALETKTSDATRSQTGLPEHTSAASQHPPSDPFHPDPPPVDYRPEFGSVGSSPYAPVSLHPPSTLHLPHTGIPHMPHPQSHPQPQSPTFLPSTDTAEQQHLRQLQVVAQVQQQQLLFLQDQMRQMQVAAAQPTNYHINGARAQPYPTPTHTQLPRSLSIGYPPYLTSDDPSLSPYSYSVSSPTARYDPISLPSAPRSMHTPLDAFSGVSSSSSLFSSAGFAPSPNSISAGLYEATAYADCQYHPGQRAHECRFCMPAFSSSLPLSVSPSVLLGPSALSLSSFGLPASPYGDEDDGGDDHPIDADEAEEDLALLTRFNAQSTPNIRARDMQHAASPIIQPQSYEARAMLPAFLTRGTSDPDEH